MIFEGFCILELLLLLKYFELELFSILDPDNSFDPPPISSEDYLECKISDVLLGCAKWEICEPVCEFKIDP